MTRLAVSLSLFLLPGLLAAEKLPGSLDWVSRLELSTPRSGIVREVLVSEGDRVAEDTVLIRLERRDVQAQLAAAEAALREAREALDEAGRERDRTQELYDRTLLSDHDLQLAKIAFVSAQAAYEKALAARVDARLADEYTEIRAPYPALILETLVQPGQTVVNRIQVTPMITLARSDALRATARATPAQVKALQFGESLRIQVDGVELTGTLVNAGLLADKGSEQLLYPVEVEFAWPEGRNWRAGQAAEIVLP